jgi:hypothetical protein
VAALSGTWQVKSSDVKPSKKIPGFSSAPALGNSRRICIFILF